MSDSPGRTQTESHLATEDSPPAASPYPADYPFAPQLMLGREEAASVALCKSKPPAQEAEPLQKPIALAWWIVLGLSGASVNFFLAPLVSVFDGAAIVVAVAYGVLLAELAAQSLWIVWSARPLWQRLLIGTLGGEALFVCFLVGIRVSEDHGSDFPQMVRIMLCSLPLVMLSVQAPLWALRIYGRWRIIPLERATRESPRPLAIGDICAATIVVALALSLLRLASNKPEFFETAWVGWLIAVPIIAAVSFASLAPAIHFVLRWGRPVVGLLVWWGGAAVVMVATLLLIAVISGNHIGGEEYLVALLTVSGSGALVWWLLCFLRGRRYRLVTQN